MSEFRKHGEMLRDERRGSPAIKRQTDAAKKLFTTRPEVAMSMVEELKACASIAAQYKEHEDPFLLVELQEMSQELFLDHGQALVEALADAERYRWLRDNDDPSGEVPYITRQVCNSWGNWVDDVALTGAVIDTAIDLARTKAGAGGGA